MKLCKLLCGVGVTNDISPYLSQEVDELMEKAERQSNNGMFFCYTGNNDGYKLIKSAINNGATVIVAETYISCDVTLVIVKNIRKAMAIISQNFYDTSNMKIIGITGTNGKTSTSFLIKDILTNAGYKVGLIGTQGVYYEDVFLPATLTTPDPILLNELFAVMNHAKVDFIVMEVSAHAIALDKVYGINFVSKVITNITCDHLDYFKDMETYAKTKLDFISQGNNRIINIDDKRLNIYSNDDMVKKYGLNNPSDSFAVELNKDCSRYTINIEDNVYGLSTHIFGLFNVYNVLAAAQCCYSLGVKFSKIIEAIENFKPVEGRFNVINIANQNKIIIDFAHTPDGLKNVLITARNITENKLIVVFGCGGNRDKQKRAKMGEIAETYADYCFITTDNPRFELPIDILSDILKGMSKNIFHYEESRALAIEKAINMLKNNDTVIICGKGGENYIDIKGTKIPYSDFEQVQKNIKRLTC